MTVNTINNKYIEQFKRMERWYKLFQKINDGQIHDRESDYYQDTVYAFFQNCFHLKDWLINSEAIDKDDVHALFINKEEDMQICRALCNGSKHLELTSNHIDPNTKIKNKKINLTLSNVEEPQIKVNYEIEVNGQSYDAFELATRCMDLWRTFLSRNNIQIV